MAEPKPQEDPGGSSEDAEMADDPNSNPNTDQPQNTATPVNMASTPQAPTPAGTSTATQALSHSLQLANLNQNAVEFSMLPKEAQNEIWRSTFKPRLIEWGVGAPVPAVLQVNHAAREFAKTQYWFANWSNDITNVSTWVHQKIDVIYWKHRGFRSAVPWWNVAMPPAWIGRLHKLAMDIYSTGIFLELGDKLTWDINPILWSELEYRCPDLKTLYLILEPTPLDDDSWEDLEQVKNWKNISTDEEIMIVSILKEINERMANRQWVPDVVFMRKKPREARAPRIILRVG